MHPIQTLPSALPIKGQSIYAIVFTPLLLKSLKQVEKLLLNARHNIINYSTLPFYWQTQGAVAGALRQTDYKTNYKYQNTRHWH
jgi:hypothetical protein